MPKQTTAQKLGLTIPPSRVTRRKIAKKRTSAVARNMIAAAVQVAVEYTLNEAAMHRKHDGIKETKKVKVCHILAGVRENDDLNGYFGTGVFPKGGVLPNINPALLPQQRIAGRAPQGMLKATAHAKSANSEYY